MKRVFRLDTTTQEEKKIEVKIVKKRRGLRGGWGRSGPTPGGKDKVDCECQARTKGFLKKDGGGGEDGISPQCGSLKAPGGGNCSRELQPM